MCAAEDGEAAHPSRGLHEAVGRALREGGRHRLGVERVGCSVEDEEAAPAHQHGEVSGKTREAAAAEAAAII